MTVKRNLNKTYQNEPTGRQSVLNKPYLGFVKEVNDSIRMGRMRVWIPELSPKPEDKTGWFMVNYASPFAGGTPIEDNKKDGKEFKDTQKSYGMWFLPPDLENEVIILFINGDPNRGFAVAYPFHQYMNHMIPSIGSNKTTRKTTEPVSEYNKKDKSINLADPERPPFEPLYYGLKNQGLYEDFTRGQTSSNVRRETPTRSHGILTPRGNHMVFDDGFKEDELGPNTFDANNNPAHEFNPENRETDKREDELIRFRTRSGAQVLISESDGFVYFISRDGKNWLEMSNDGKIDIFGFLDISIRGNENINLHGDKDVNIEAGRNVNIKASAQYEKSGDKIEDGSGKGGNVNIDSYKTTKFKCGKEFNVHCQKNLNLLSDSEGKFTSKNTLHLRSLSGNILETAPEIHLNGPTASKASSQEKIPKTFIKDKDHLVATFGDWPFNKRETITNRIPSHEPYEEHSSRTTGLNGVVQESSVLNDIQLSEKEKSIINNSSTPPGDTADEVETPSGRKEKTGETRMDTPIFETKPSQETFNDPKNLSVSDNGAELISKFEGFESSVYNDAAGFPTIGFGHKLTEEEKQSGKININGEKINIQDGISKSQAKKVLKQDAEVATKAIKNSVKTELTQKQFDSLTSFAFNVGPGAFRKSTLLKELNNGNFEKVPGELTKWNKAGGEVLQGLVNRRNEEAELFKST